VVLNKIVLKNFCGFQDFTAPVERLTVFIGPNNGGKTTLLRAISLAWELFRRTQSASADISRRQHFGEQLRNLKTQFETQMQDNRQHLRQNPEIAEQHQSLLQQYDQNRAGLQQQLLPNVQPIGELINLFRLPSLNSLFFQHQTTEATIILELQISGQAVLVEVSLNTTGNAKVDVTLAGESLFISSDESKAQILQKMYTQSIDFVPPATSLLAGEDALAWPQIEEKLKQGREFEVWRNRIHWLAEGILRTISSEWLDDSQAR
jgi:AAA15 family ATPase/GTPase